jgi:hypothetical protein
LARAAVDVTSGWRSPANGSYHQPRSSTATAIVPRQSLFPVGTAGPVVHGVKQVFDMLAAKADSRYGGRLPRMSLAAAVSAVGAASPEQLGSGAVERALRSLPANGPRAALTFGEFAQVLSYLRQERGGSGGYDALHSRGLHFDAGVPLGDVEGWAQPAPPPSTAAERWAMVSGVHQAVTERRRRRQLPAPPGVDDGSDVGSAAEKEDPPPPAPAVLRRVVALADFAAQRVGDLSLLRGEELAVTSDAHKWWEGYRPGAGPAAIGSFPSNYVRTLVLGPDPEEIIGGRRHSVDGVGRAGSAASSRQEVMAVGAESVPAATRRAM